MHVLISESMFISLFLDCLAVKRCCPGLGEGGQLQGQV